MKYLIALRRRVKGKSGFTLAEMMITMLILLMMTTVVAVGMPNAVNAYRRAIDAANAQVLLSDTVMRLRSELAVAASVGPASTPAPAGDPADPVTDPTDEILLSYTSGNSGWTYELKNSKDGIVIVGRFEEAEGTDKAKGNGVVQLLVPAKLSGAVANGKKLITNCGSISYNKTDGMFTITKLIVAKVDESYSGTTAISEDNALAKIDSLKIRNIIPKFSEQEGEGG